VSKSRTVDVFSLIAPAYDRVGPPLFTTYGRRLVERAGIADDMDVLDVATGRGAILFAAAEGMSPQGHVVGVDLAPGMVRETAAEVRQARLERVSLCRMDAARLAFPDASFDRVLCGHAIFYFPHAAHEFYRVLRPGGRVGATILARGTMAWFWEVWNRFVQPDTEDDQTAGDDGELAIDTPDGLRATFGGAGFEKLEVIEEETVFLYADKETWWATLWTVGTRDDIERMSRATLRDLRTAVFERLDAFQRLEGLHIPFRALYALGTKPEHTQKES
jgi:O-methyltransferase/aklanonic acid methyltransferase